MSNEFIYVAVNHIEPKYVYFDTKSNSAFYTNLKARVHVQKLIAIEAKQRELTLDEKAQLEQNIYNYRIVKTTEAEMQKYIDYSPNLISK